MRKKQVWRYYCDFCKKAGCHGGHMKNHEARCTNNPNRICGMCVALEHKQPPLSDLIAILPNSSALTDTRTDEEAWNLVLSPLDKALKAALPLLRARAGNCPACILAALRQAKISLPLEGFDFSAECKQAFEKSNEEWAGQYLQ